MTRSLAAYNRKRDFRVTSEPKGAPARRAGGHRFVVQMHAARRLHYDFRLELDGVLKSWAVPKGPSLSPTEKRLAVQTEDHPLSYRDFEGRIPEGEYGAGPVIVWDQGTWEPEGDPRAGLRKGHLSFMLRGKKLHGRFSLVRLRGDPDSDKVHWLLLKRSDEHVREGRAAEITRRLPLSVLSGRSIEEVEAGRRASRRAPARRPSTRSARRGPPALTQLQPQLATLSDGFPGAGNWVYEIKYDGYRILARIDRGKARLVSRNGLEWTARFPHVAQAAAALPVDNAVLDGEMCYALEDGRTDFQHLQNALRARGPASQPERLIYYLFDLLFLDGEDLSGQPLHERKERLKALLAAASPVLHYSEDLTGDARTIHAQACSLGLEGLIAKRADRPYRPGRGTDWLKLKCQKRQEFVIVGMTPPQGSRTGLGALLLALHRDGRLQYVGKVGTGFTQRSLTELTRRLRALQTDRPPVDNPPRSPGVIWVRPKLACEVSFTEMTRDGNLRHPSFEGLREDKPPAEISDEPAVSPRRTKKRRAVKPDPVREKEQLIIDGTEITHPDRVMDARSGARKKDLARYHDAMSDRFLPYARQRPLALVRCPGGNAEQCFFQKHAVAGFSDAIKRRRIEGKEALHIDDRAGLLELVQFNVVEFHGWGSRLPAWGKPDWMVFDLDPDESLPFTAVVDAARELKEQLDGLDLRSFIKTTGGKGLHLVVPIEPRYDWDTIKAFTQGVAVSLARRAPERYVATMSKRRRQGKIFLDYLRNVQGSTAVLPYSPRRKSGMTVALPVAWRDLPHLDPREFDVLTVPRLLKRRRRDPWAEFFDTPGTLPKVALKALGI